MLETRLKEASTHPATVEPGCHMSPMSGESLSIIIQGENSQNFTHEQSPTIVFADAGDYEKIISVQRL